MRCARIVGSAMTVLTVVAAILLTPLAGSTYASADVAPVNPVRVELDGHPANSGFLVFVEGDVTLNADEAEGTLAMGGNLAFGTSYNIQAGGGPVFPTFTAPGDSGPTYLFVGGGVSWPSVPSAPVLKVLNSGFTKIADTSTYTAGNVDGNGAVSLYQVRQPGQPYGSAPRIEGSTSTQDGASIAEPVPADLINVDGAFALYRQITADLASCRSPPNSPTPTPGKHSHRAGRPAPEASSR